MSAFFFKCDNSISIVDLPSSFRDAVAFYKEKAKSSYEVDVTDFKVVKEDESCKFVTCIYDCGALNAGAPPNSHFEGNMVLGDVLVFQTKGSISDVNEDVVCRDTMDIDFIKSTIQDFSKNLYSFLLDKGFMVAPGSKANLFPHIHEVVSGGVSTILYSGITSSGQKYRPKGGRIWMFEVDLLTKEMKKRSLTSLGVMVMVSGTSAV